MRTGYLLYSYDTTPFSDDPDHPIAVYLDKVKAFEVMNNTNKILERGSKEDGYDRPDSRVSIKEIDVL